MTNEEVLDLCERWRVDHDERAFNVLYRQYHRLCRRWACGMWRRWQSRCGWLDLADWEAMALTGLMGAAASYNGAAAFSTWTVWWTRNSLRFGTSGLLTAKRTGVCVSLDDAVFADGRPLSEVVPAPMTNTSVAHDLEAVLGRLAPRDRAVLEAVYLRGDCLEDAARDMGISRARAGQLRDRALERARRLACDT